MGENDELMMNGIKDQDDSRGGDSLVDELLDDGMNFLHTPLHPYTPTNHHINNINQPTTRRVLGLIFSHRYVHYIKPIYLSIFLFDSFLSLFSPRGHRHTYPTKQNFKKKHHSTSVCLSPPLQVTGLMSAVGNSHWMWGNWGLIKKNWITKTCPNFNPPERCFYPCPPCPCISQPM